MFYLSLINVFENTLFDQIAFVKGSYRVHQVSCCLEDGKLLPNIKHQLLAYLNTANVIA